MNTTTIRSKFLSFFQQKNHYLSPAVPLINKEDPQLLFVNAGMNPFKNIFLNNKKPTHLRIANTQPCLRVAGKHNDLETVGKDTYHHTLFEMLGNWSFGNYFKQEAIQWAWELLTQVYHLPIEQLYVTVFSGDNVLEKDEEAYNIWKQYVDEEKIILGNKKDNFWEMGATGPCGPASEIHIDIRPLAERERISGKYFVNKDHPLVIEIWNLVFIQYQRLTSQKLIALPQKHIDTGMGLERLAMVSQNKISTYDTDIFQPIIKKLVDIADKQYGSNIKITTAMRVIADHIRAITFAIADGTVPSNNKAGYVIKRILRRAVRYGYTVLDFKVPFLYKLVSIVSTQFKDIFPHVKKQQDYIEKVILQEEKSFFKTIVHGLQCLDKFIHNNAKNKIIPGSVVFELYDTYGFPPDLTALIAQENNFIIDDKGFEQYMQQQKKRSKNATVIHYQDWNIIYPDIKTVFVGYKMLRVCDTVLIKYRTIEIQQKMYYQLVFEKTPFYPEGGGQIGDTGEIIGSNNEKIPIINTQKENDLIVHYTEDLPKDVKGYFQLQVHETRRQCIANNHTATHLLQAALTQVLGKHVVQKGSLVTDKALRFDFTHFQKITPKAIQDIEQIVNQKIRQNIITTIHENMPIAQAKALGAKAFFGEKYGEKVRVVILDAHFSTEFCGGTHVRATGELGICKIIQENAIAAGIRRIEAITGYQAEKHIYYGLHTLQKVNALIKNKDSVQAINTLINEKKQLEQKLAQWEQKALHTTQHQLEKRIVFHQKIHYLITHINSHTADELKKIAFALQKKYPQSIWILTSTYGKKVYIMVMVAKQLVEKNCASTMLQTMLPYINGKGGGNSHFAMGSGEKLAGIQEALVAVNNKLLKIEKSIGVK